MSGRSITAAMEAALAANHVRLCLLAELSFDSGTLYATNLPYSLDWNGHTWLGLGKLGGIDAVQEGEEIQAYGLALTLSGVESAHVSIALGEQYQGRRVKVYLGLFDDNYAILADPVLVFRGRMDHMELEQGATFTIRVNCEGRLADFERARVRRYNHEDQIAVYPDDRGFEFVPQMIEKPLNWGVPT